MTATVPTDPALMAEALRLARRGRYGSHPNPRVGCVIARDGVVLGRGWHAVAGSAHAEVNALGDAGNRARGATAYVTLEPCSHHGRTPPCTTALIDAGIARVVAAMRDPYPAVAGTGIAALEAAGIAVSVGLLEEEARALNAGYLSRIERGRPKVTVKIAASLDGATAMADGESRWITSAAARRDVQRLRACSGAVLTGVGTVLDDDPSLTVRDVDVPRQPLRAVLDSKLRTPASARMLSLDGETVIYGTRESGRDALERAGARVVTLPAEDGRVSLAAVLEDLAEAGVNDLLVEAGPTVAGAFLAGGHADEIVVYQAPHLLGSETRRMLVTPGMTRLDERIDLEILDLRQVGVDLRITARPKNRES